jgi:PAT family beta-lactamase induction signal transducer AmpG
MKLPGSRARVLEFFKKGIVGFTYGTSFPLTIVILDYWLKDCGVSNSTIGFFAFFHLPFILKLFFAPLIDNYDIPYLSKIFGRCRSWVVFSQSMLITSIIVMANADPKSNIYSLMIAATFVAISDGFQNIVLYKYQIDNVKKTDFGYIAGIVSFGHRLGTITTKLVVLYIAHFANWKIAYECAAILVFICMIFILNMEAPKKIDSHTDAPGNIPSHKLNNSRYFSKLIDQLRHLFHSEQYGSFAIWILVSYKASDFFAQKMSRVFCLEIGFSKLDMANIVQFFGSIAVVLGGFIGGFFIKKYGSIRSMIYFSIFHMISLFSYIFLFGKNYHMLCTVIFCDGITGGAVTAAFLAFLYEICKNGSQYAIAWAIHEIGGLIFRSMSGIFVDNMGWKLFFITAPIISIPNLIILNKLVSKVGRR